MSTLIAAQMQRGAQKSLRWMSTLYPTPAYAMEAEMGVEGVPGVLFQACHADEATADPVAYWLNVQLTRSEP